MKNKTILKAVKIALVVCVMLTACITPTFAETATIPEYNGYIPSGEYRANYGGDYYNIPRGELPTLDISTSGVWFEYAGENYSYLGAEIMEDEPDVSSYIDLYADSLDTCISQDETILIGSDVPVTEEQYNAFFFYFVSTAEPEPEPPTNIYQTCYDLVNTYIYGGSVTANTYNDLVCISLATLSCILVYAFPFIVVFAFLKVWFF